MGFLFSFLKFLLPLASNETLRTMVLTVVLFAGSYILISEVNFPRGKPNSWAEQVHTNTESIQELKIQNERVLATMGVVAEGIESLKKDVADNKATTEKLDKRLWEFMIQQRMTAPRKASLTY